ncbi:hypothetical protein Poli38472_004370 [Pythium oligandrum]|uniref:G domain-containing protein n=1 Tax=Pythium oligandrum TaxID=41045 RepID=A0A8K1C9S2_PYTOL|nr:hypothetical protein Poli38472_004370 [Pythium oligandrum]|eukprot:TMW59301.1 hypothetical protein Poli38472_004370 [Pythium oligandrum]
MAHVRETRVFLRAPGAGKTTLINCLAGERVFASRDEEGATQDFQRIVGDVAYIDTPDVVTEQTAIQMLAEVITDVLSKPGTYKVFFVVRLVSGRVVNEELMAIERLLDAIHNENLLFSVLVNNVGKRQYELLRRQDEAFEQLVVAINSGKYMASDVHIIPRFQELDEKKNEIVQLPDDILEFIEQRAPSVVVPVGVLQSSEQVIHSVEDLQPSGKDLTEAKHRNEYSNNLHPFVRENASQQLKDACVYAPNRKILRDQLSEKLRDALRRMLSEVNEATVRYGLFILLQFAQEEERWKGLDHSTINDLIQAFPTSESSLSTKLLLERLESALEEQLEL